MANDDDDMDKPVTRRELREILADYPTKRDLREALAEYPKRVELEAWGGALNAKIDTTTARLDAKIDALGARVDRLGVELSAELAQHTNRILDAVYAITGAVDEKYNDLPPRVLRLEAKVFPPKRQRRR